MLSLSLSVRILFKVLAVVPCCPLGIINTSTHGLREKQLGASGLREK